MKKDKGFTLVEMLISLFVGIIAIMAIYTMINLGQKTSSNVERKVSANQDARLALEMMSLEIEMASYNPRPDYEGGSFWATPGTCSASSNQGYKGIQQATNSAITVEMNMDGGTSIGGNEVITYAYNATDQYITRSLDCGSGSSPFLGDIPANQRSLRVINSTSTVPVFRYYDGLGLEITSASLPARIPDIARIDITLWV